MQQTFGDKQETSADSQSPAGVQVFKASSQRPMAEKLLQGGTNARIFCRVATNLESSAEVGPDLESFCRVRDQI